MKVPGRRWCDSDPGNITGWVAAWLTECATYGRGQGRWLNLGTAIISHTCSRTRQLKLESYDRLFPNQDTMPKGGGFGNLIALPLQKMPREHGCSVFVDAELYPYHDQWAFLASIHPMAPHEAVDDRVGVICVGGSRGPGFRRCDAGANRARDMPTYEN